MVTVAVIGVALVLASGVAFAQFDPIDNPEYPPDPFGPGGGGHSEPWSWQQVCGTLSIGCLIDHQWVTFSCEQCQWYYCGVPVGPPTPCSLNCP